MWSEGEITRYHEISSDRSSWGDVADVACASKAAAQPASQPAANSGRPLQVRRATEAAGAASVGGASAWFLDLGAGQVGPVSERTVRDMISVGGLAPWSRVMAMGSGSWGRVVDTAPFSDAFPEGIRGIPVSAGFWPRVAAGLLDALCVAAMALAVGVVVYGVMRLCGIAAAESQAVLRLFSVVILTLAAWIYSTCLESTDKQATWGKMLLGIKVVGNDGSPLLFGRANGRFWAKFFTAMTLGVGFLACLFTEKRQALHDLMAGARVVRNP
jgi:uncharacterized RDD family membrane protein YckC